jgi:hypothetical protein
MPGNENEIRKKPEDTNTDIAITFIPKPTSQHDQINLPAGGICFNSDNTPGIPFTIFKC